MTKFNSFLKHLSHFILFFVLCILCYFYIDRDLCLQMIPIREKHYIFLRVLSIICSPATQLTIWTVLFLWVLLIKKKSFFSLAFYPITASLITTNTLIRFIKVFFGRSRPDMFIDDQIYSLQFLSFERVFSSFPSGHASVVASILGYLAAKQPKYALFWITFTLAFSFCRVAIGAHFLSDVLFGNYLGFFYTWMFYFYQCDHKPAYLDYTQGDFSWIQIKKFIPSSKVDGLQEP